MPSSVENKAVSMTFDNGAFEKNVGTTLSTLDKLKAALSFQSSKNDFSSITANAGKVDMSTLANSVENISNKFSAMGAIAFTVLQSITHKVLDTAGQIASAFTVTPATTGFSEYELKLGSIQTIMAGTGASLEDVNAKLNELNEYSDKTIYSFADMTTNIGKFTNAGVSLDDSVAAIQGIANAAALSGANADEASRAMYNFGQSISSGSVKLMDWKSIELANMATVEFKTELMESAVAAGTLNKTADGLYTTLAGTPITATKGFNESLSEQWLTADALTTTLGRYSDATTDIGARATAAAQDVKTFTQMIGTMKESAQSGWAETAEIVIGNFDEAKWLFTGINNIIGGMISNSAKARNEVLGEWKALGGRSEVLIGLSNIFNSFLDFAGAIKKAFREIFPKKTGQDLYELSLRFREFTKKLKMGEDTLLNVKRVFKGVFAILSIGIAVVKGVFRIFSTLFGLFAKSSGGGILTLFGKIGLIFINLQRVLVKEGGIEKTFSAIIVVIEKAGRVVASFFGMIFNFFGSLDLSPVTSAFGDMFSALRIGNITGVFKGAFNAVVALKNAIIDFFVGSKKAAGSNSSKTEETVERTGGLFETLYNIVKRVAKFFGSVGSAIVGLFKAIGSAVGSIGSGLGDAIASGNFDRILSALKVGLLGGVLLVVKDFIKNGLNFGQRDLFKALSGTFNQLTDNLKTMQASVKADILMKIAIALAALTVSVIALSLIDPVQLSIAMGAVVAGLGALVGVMAIMGKIANDADSAFKLVALGGVIILIAGATIILALALRMLDGMGWQDTTAGMTGLIGLLLAMAASTQELTRNADGLIKAAAGLVIIASALVILSLALKVMGTMGWEETAIGITSIAASLVILFSTLKQMPEGYEMLKMGIGLGIIAGSLTILSSAIWLFDKLDTATFANGLSKIAITLAVFGRAISLFPKESEILKIAFAVGILGAGMVVMSGAIWLMSRLSLSELTKGLLGIAGAMKVLTIAASGGKASLGSGIALVLIANGISKLVEVIKTMGNMDNAVIVKGIIAIGVAMTALSVAVRLITPLVPEITALGAGLLMVGLAIGVAAAGIGILLGGLAKLIGVLQQGAGKMAEALGVFVKAIPGIIAGILTGIIDGIFGMKEVIFDGVSKLLLMFLDFIIAAFPKIKKAIIEFIKMIVGVVKESAPVLIEAGWFLLLNFLKGIRDNISELVSVVGDIVINFLNAFEKKIPSMVKALVGFLITLFRSVSSGLGQLAGTLLFGLGIDFIKGFWKGIKSQISKLGEIIMDIIHGVIDWFKDGFGIFSPSRVMMDLGINLIKGLIKGIVSIASTLFDWFIALPGLILGLLGDAISWLWDVGSNFIGGLLEGTINAAVAFMNWYLELPGKILGWIGDAISWLWNVGSDFIGGLLEGTINAAVAFMNWYLELPGKILGWLVDAGKWLWQKGFDIISGLLSGIAKKAADLALWFLGLPGKLWGFFKDALGWLVNAGGKIIQGLLDGLRAVWTSVENWIKSKVQWVKDQWEKVTSWVADIGGSVGGVVDDREGPTLHSATSNGPENLTKEFDRNTTVEESAEALGNRVTSALSESLSSASRIIENMGEFNPTITPVLDLSMVKKEAKNISSFLPTNPIEGGYIQAQSILIETEQRNEEQTEMFDRLPTEIKFEQNNYSPKQLSTGDIYRQTRSQITKAKEELSIP